MSQTVSTQFGEGIVVDREASRGRVSYKVEGPGFSTWIEATAMPLDFEWMPHPDDIQDNSVTLPYNPSPQTWVNPNEQNIVPGRQELDSDKRTAPADSVDLQEDGGTYEPLPDPRLFATGNLDPEDIQAKLGPKYVNAFQEHDFTSLQARLEEHPEIVLAEYRERVAELVAQADQEHLERVGRNEALEASDPQIREAAWKDVAAKARRLRHSGQVMTRAAHPDRIASQVTGDHGTYEVIVIRSNIFQGNSAVDAWSCECPWGQWAFKREHSFVGRLCSHAYATLMELQALNNSKTRTKNPVWSETPHYNFSSRTAQVNWVEDSDGSFWVQFMGGQVIYIYPDGTYQISDGTLMSTGQAPSVEEAKRLSLEEVAQFWPDRTAEMVDIRPVGWDPYARNLMNRLRDLWEEGSRPGRQKERNEEVRELVEELRERGYATDGIMASLDRPKGYGDIPDYGTSQDYILEHELHKREDVEEPEFVYPAGGDHGIIDDINDGKKTAASAFLPEGTQVERISPNGSGTGMTGVVARDYNDPDGWSPVVVRWDGDHANSQEDLSLLSWGEYEDGTPTKRLDDPWNIHGGRTADSNWEEYGSGDEFGGYEDPYYVDPMEREDYPEDDIVANFQRNAGHLLEGGSGTSGGHDDIADAAAAHLKVAGRNFTMAEQQALIDEDDGQPYDRSSLRLDGTHYI